ncbi:unnamed protein product [Chrysodeixis includens]|uniref:DUF4774 domain-containing protein n=1 Tax=Chrysodeixis includens TaxID=689277 RepID=A0A9P0C1L7_CHRIL|nr:unnamed protein product [Chrysodeixis includens]
MSRHCLFGILMLLACFSLEVSSRPSNNELTTPNEIITEAPHKEERTLVYDKTITKDEPTIKEIMQKIKAVNDALEKPNKRNPFQWNAPPQSASGYILDQEILKKLQQVIASGKLNPFPNNVQQQESNTINNENLEDVRYSRQLSPYGPQAQMAVVPLSYLMNMPVLVMPPMNNMYGSVNPMDYSTKIQTRQEGPTSPTSPFPTFPSFPPFQWPFAPLFPILIRDPLLSIMNGGGWNNFIEYGQNADVCRRQKSNDEASDDKNDIELERRENTLYPNVETRTRQKRAVKKRTVNHATPIQNIDPKLNKFFAVKPTTAKPTAAPIKQNTKTNFFNEGDVKFPVFDFFTNKNRQPTGPGFFINRLKVRRGGVAIAGPGGVATAGRGGTAIVGPGGLAYTQPGGLAVAGPAARIVALSPDADLNSIANRLHEQSTINGSISHLLQAIPEGKIVATGPIIYYHPNKR